MEARLQLLDWKPGKLVVLGQLRCGKLRALDTMCLGDKENMDVPINGCSDHVNMDVSAVVQCSSDRLDHVYEQCLVWSGKICVSVLCDLSSDFDGRYVSSTCDIARQRLDLQPGPCSIQLLLSILQEDEQLSITRILTAIEDGLKEGIILCELRMCIVVDLQSYYLQKINRNPNQKSLQREENEHETEFWYPINCMRNIALDMADTDLVFLVDADFVPSISTRRICSDQEIYCKLWWTCVVEKKALLFPAFELCNNEQQKHIALETVHQSKNSLYTQFTNGDVIPFAQNVFPQGHRATDYDRWFDSCEHYEVNYEEGFEPYIILFRGYVPRYDERFEGYGKNKVIHLFHIHSLDIRFVVDPCNFVIHLPHQQSHSWHNTFGDNRNPKRFSHILQLYEDAKHAILRERHCYALCSPSENYIQDILGQWYVSDWVWFLRISSHVFNQNSTKSPCGTQNCCIVCDLYDERVLFHLYQLKFQYLPATLSTKTVCTNTHLSTDPFSVTIITTASMDRLDHLEELCNRWSGSISVAIMLPCNRWHKFTSVIRLKALFTKLNKNRRGHLCITAVTREKTNLNQTLPSLSLDNPLSWNNTLANNSKVLSAIKDNDYKCTSENLFPINGLRNVALRASKTPWVWILDVDLMPASFCDKQIENSLCDIVSNSSINTVLVVPALEYWPFNCELEYFNIMDQCLNETDPMYAKSRAVSLVEENKLTLFHAYRYHEGHTATNLDQWKDAMEHYSISYIDGFEPFAIVHRELVPNFDERFRGYGCDKVSFFFHLSTLGVDFVVHPLAFLIERVHAPTNDWVITFGSKNDRDPIQKLRIYALYTRMKGQVDLIYMTECIDQKEQEVITPDKVAANAINTASIWSAPLFRGIIPVNLIQANSQDAIWRINGDYGQKSVSFGGCSDNNDQSHQILEQHHQPHAWVNIAMSRGTYSPIKHDESIDSRYSGVQSRYWLSDTQQRALLQYKVRFGQSFDWVKGGKLCGLFGLPPPIIWMKERSSLERILCPCGDCCSSSDWGWECGFRWKEKGKGECKIVLKHGNDTIIPNKSRSPFTHWVPYISQKSKDFRFLRNVWQELSIEISVSNHINVGCGECSRIMGNGEMNAQQMCTKLFVRAWYNSQVVTTTTIAWYFPKEMGLGGTGCGINRDCKIDSVDHSETIHSIKVLPVCGINFTCHFGGSTPDWGANKDEVIEIGDLRIDLL